MASSRLYPRFYLPEKELPLAITGLPMSKPNTILINDNRGIAAVGADFILNLIAYNLVRIPKLIAA
jgi:hypothetical protein